MAAGDSNPRVLFIAPPRVGGFDVTVPLLQRLRQLVPAVEVVGLYRDGVARSLVLRDPILGQALERTVDRHLVLRRTSGRPDVTAIGAAILAAVGSKAPVVIHSGSAAGGFFGRLAVLARLRGGIVFRVPATTTITLGEQEGLRATPAADEVMLCLSEHTVAQARQAGFNRARGIGFPRLYHSWLTHVRAVAPKIVSESAPWAVDQGFAVVLLSSTVPGVFEVEELDQWFNEVIGSLRKHHPRLRVLIKPHPLQRPDQLDRLTAQLNPTREAVTHLHVNALASVCQFAVSCASSVILDVLAMGTPVVLHQRFTNHWLARHPEGSKFLNLGVPHSFDETSLARQLIGLTKTDIVRTDLAGMLGHSEEMSVLTDFLLKGIRP
jgi:hypothetical protein